MSQAVSMCKQLCMLLPRNTRRGISPAMMMRAFSSSNEGEGTGGIIDPVDLTPPIPLYMEKTGETIKLKRARLLYQSRKRGMLENGLLLSTFAGIHLDTLTPEQLTSYDRLINIPTNDWEIYYWMTGVKEVPEDFQSDVMDLLKKHAQNEDRALRIRQPDLS